MIKGKTSSGFEYELKREDLDDYELLEVLHEIDKGNEGLIPEMVDRLLGEDQKTRLKEHIRSQKNGKVSVAKMMNEVKEIFDGCKEIKN